MGIIIYDGPSVLDGSPVLGVVTGALERGIQHPTSNQKISHGYAVQLWIVMRDMHPMDALHGGADVGICGTCPLRAQEGRKRLCYVNPMTIGQVWKHATRPEVERVTPYDLGRTRMGLAKYIRLGAYGDPVALPFEVCDDLLRGARAAGARAWSGYTHQAQVADPRWKSILMASAEGDPSTLQAQGWRTFTVTNPGEAVEGSVLCPASEEAGKKTSCAKCNLCNGVQGEMDARKSIYIPVHGASPVAKRRDFAALLQQVEQEQRAERLAFLQAGLTKFEAQHFGDERDAINEENIEGLRRRIREEGYG